MMVVQIVAPTSEPVSVADAKSFLRVLDDGDDILIESIIKAVREYAQNITGLQFEEATFELYISDLSTVIKLPRNPVKSISKIEYLDENDTYQLVDSSLYYLYEEFGVGLVVFKELPSISTQVHKKAIKITFISGYESMPESINAWMKVKISTLYENREQFVIGASISEFSNTLVDGLLTQHKIREF